MNSEIITVKINDSEYQLDVNSALHAGALKKKGFTYHDLVVGRYYKHKNYPNSIYMAIQKFGGPTELLLVKSEDGFSHGRIVTMNSEDTDYFSNFTEFKVKQVFAPLH